MTEKNPYCFRAMIPVDSDMFFGREREMRRIRDLLSEETPQCVSIIGERRIGKSSLASRVFHELGQIRGTRTVYIDCDGLANACRSKTAGYPGPSSAISATSCSMKKNAFQK
jgi:hypothetical protein